jgi:hypothetical protein
MRSAPRRAIHKEIAAKTFRRKWPVCLSDLPPVLFRVNRPRGTMFSVKDDPDVSGMLTFHGFATGRAYAR